MKRYITRLNIAIGTLLSFTACAGSFGPQITSQDQPWSITLSAGSANYQVTSNDRNSALGRVALGNEMMLAGDIALGLELGVQTGNKICLDLRKKTEQNPFNFISVDTTLSPTLDLLVTTKSDPIGSTALFAQIKGGLAYRHWKMERIPVTEISQLAGELQAGLGYPITALASLSVLYQGIYGNKPNYQVNPTTQRENLSNIPTLHSILFGLSFNL